LECADLPPTEHHARDQEWQTRLRGSAARPDYRDRVSTRHVPVQIGELPPIGRPANSALLEADITTLAQVAAYSRRDLLALHGAWATTATNSVKVRACSCV
jgi:hypothetical protein